MQKRLGAASDPMEVFERVIAELDATGEIELDARRLSGLTPELVLSHPKMRMAEYADIAECLLDVLLEPLKPERRERYLYEFDLLREKRLEVAP